jgi:hypothetical protein
MARKTRFENMGVFIYSNDCVVTAMKGGEKTARTQKKESPALQCKRFNIQKKYQLP